MSRSALTYSTNLEELKSVLKASNKAYRNGEPIISDEEYDELCREYRTLTGTLFSNLEESGTVDLSVPMLSLDNIFEKEQYDKFVGTVHDLDPYAEIYVEPKVDGVALDLKYYKGMLISASTRGDGRKGEDVTQTVKSIKSFPSKISKAPDFLWVRGEAVSLKKDFEEYNSSVGNTYKNPRNFVAGTLASKNKDVSDRPVTFVPYAVISSSDGINNHHDASWQERFGFAENVFYSVAYARYLSELSYKELIESYILQRGQLPFETDGLVLKVASKDLKEKLGESDTVVNWAIAFKQRVSGKSTVILDVIYQVGRTGAVTPVAVLEPVDVGGVTISRATLHNRERLNELGVSAGSVVKVRRAGDVIPEIYEVEKISDVNVAFDFPSKCPSCGSALEDDTCKVVYTYQNGDIYCPDKFIATMEHFFSQHGMKVDGVGKEACRILVEECLISHPIELCKFVEDVPVESLSEFLDKTAYEAISTFVADLSNYPSWKFIASIGIDSIGPANAKKLDPYLIDVLEGKVEVGNVLTPAAAESFREYVSRKGYKELILKSLRLLKREEKKGTVLQGIKVVITGTLSKDRDTVEEFLTSYGAKVLSAVSKNANYLIAGIGAGSKFKKAQDLGIEILSLEKFLEKFNLQM